MLEIVVVRVIVIVIVKVIAIVMRSHHCVRPVGAETAVGSRQLAYLPAPSCHVAVCPRRHNIFRVDPTGDATDGCSCARTAMACHIVLRRDRLCSTNKGPAQDARDLLVFRRIRVRRIVPRNCVVYLDWCAK